MKNKRVILLISIIAFLLLLNSGSRPLASGEAAPEPGLRAEGPITVVMDDSYPPYVFRDEDGKLQGILIDQWALWSKKTGIRAEISAMDWPDAIAAMKNGEFDVIDTAFINEERDAWLDFASPYVSIDVAVFHDKDIGGITDIRSLRGFAVAVKAEDNSIQVLRQNGITDIVVYPSYEAIIAAASQGETRLFVMDEPPAIYLLYKYNIASRFNKSVAIDSGSFHRAVKSGDVTVLRVVEDGFNRISLDDYQKIDETWFGAASKWMYISNYLHYLIIGLAAVGAVILFITAWNHRLRRSVQMKTAELHREKELIHVTIHSIGEGVVATDITGSITLINPAARQLTGWGDDALGRPSNEVVRLVNEKTGDKEISPAELVLQSGKVTQLAGLPELVSRCGERIPVAHSVSPIRDEEGNTLGAVMVLRDFRQERDYRARIENIMNHDAMTGLCNRWYMEEILKAYERDTQASCTLIMGDMNGLKLVNDAFGHFEGDRLIQKVAAIIQACSSPGDIVGRWGGDEFLVILPEADAGKAEVLIERVTSKCAQQSDETSPLSIAMGFALKPCGSDDINGALREAEQWTYRRKLMNEKSFRNSVINALLSTLAEKSGETQEHGKRLQAYCRQVGTAINISSKELDEISLLSMLHDIGKVGINDSILQKPGPLSREEWMEMRKHPEIGYRIAQNNIDLAPIAECILSHHERWDGAGYPRGLSREEIPVLSRILAVVDAFDAMTNERVYHKAVSVEEAAGEIMKNAGTQFDPAIARVFIRDVLALDWID